MFRFELFKGKNGQNYFRLVAANGEIVAQSEGYLNESGALNAINLIQRGASTAKVYDLRK